MDIKQQKLLKDILVCIEHFKIYIRTPKTFETYDNNMLLQDAVERNIITIGEAMNALLKLNGSSSFFVGGVDYVIS